MWRNLLVPTWCLVTLTAGLLGCRGDPLGPEAVTDALRIPLASAVRHAGQETPFRPFGSLEGTLDAGGLVSQMLAAGRHDRSLRADGTPTDPISGEGYDAVAYVVDSDIITPQGVRFTRQSLFILSWSGLDRDRGVADALMSVTAARDNAALVAGTYGVETAGAFYYFGPDARAWENSPTIEVVLESVRVPSLDGTGASPCRGSIPPEVDCTRSGTVGRVSGVFRFFAREVGPGTAPSSLEVRPIRFDLPVTALRLVDTLRVRAAGSVPRER